MNSRFLSVFALCSFAGFLASCAAPAVPTASSVPLVLDKQGSFFVGGRTIKSDTLSTLPAYAPAGSVAVEQMYVRYQVPANAPGASLVLIHGCCLTGKTWETTPDGRMGWDEYFVRKGHPVYVIDQVARGRSAANATHVVSVLAGKTPASETPKVFMASQESAWAIFRFGQEYPKAFSDLRFPLAGIDEFWKQMVPDWLNTMPTPNPTVPALAQLAAKLERTVLVSHSQSGIYPFQVAAMSDRGVAGIVAVEPAACPAATADLKPYLKMPIMVLWGDYVEQFPRWAPRLTGCAEFVQAVNRAGGTAESIVLPTLGIRGNSHMLMQDNNSLEIGDLVLAWIDRHVGPNKR